jgi:hypothetical protein
MVERPFCERHPASVDHIRRRIGRRCSPHPLQSDSDRKDEFRSEVDQCIFKGFLRNDPSSEVTMAGGCPGEDSFDVRFDF